jgi:catechol 2,3-dioxygenase-like lactoylglutathione lyase family enzyme
MALRIQHKRSSVPGKVPSPSDLKVGELAVNFPDRAIYTRDPDGNVVRLGGTGEAGGGGTTSATPLAFTVVAGQATYEDPSLAPGRYDVFLDGHLIERSGYASTEGSFTLPSAPEEGSDLVALVYDVSAPAAVEATASADQSAFQDPALAPGSYDVYVDGHLLERSYYDSSVDGQATLPVGLPEGSRVVFLVHDSLPAMTEFQPSEGQELFEDADLKPGEYDVYFDGHRLPAASVDTATAGSFSLVGFQAAADSDVAALSRGSAATLDDVYTMVKDLAAEVQALKEEIAILKGGTT